MKSKSRIKMNFAKARNDAAGIDQVAANLRSLSRNQLNSSINNLSSAWTGANARLFLRKEGQLQNDIEQTARALNEIADDIRSVSTTQRCGPMRLPHAGEIKKQKAFSKRFLKPQGDARGRTTIFGKLPEYQVVAIDKKSGG